MARISALGAHPSLRRPKPESTKQEHLTHPRP
jgi:hypothetical protein